MNQGVPIVPVYIDGANSALFQWLGLIHPSLRSLRMPAEMQNKKGQVLRMRVGHPIRKTRLDRLREPRSVGALPSGRSLMRWGRPMRCSGTWFKGLALPEASGCKMPLAASMPDEALARRDGRLGRCPNCSRHQEFDVFCAAAAERIPGHLAQGDRPVPGVDLSGPWVKAPTRPRDLDEYDLYYQHLILVGPRRAGGWRVRTALARRVGDHGALWSAGDSTPDRCFA